MRKGRSMLCFCAGVALLVAMVFGSAHMARAVTSDEATGWWWDVSNPGHAVAMELQGQESLYLVWCVYEDSGEAVWYGALPSRASENLFTGPLLRHSGPPLASPDEVFETNAVGRVAVQFIGPNECAFTYALASEGNEQRRVVLSRFLSDTVGGSLDARGISGWWGATGKPGVGYFLESRNGQLYSGLAYYGADRAPVWRGMGGSGPLGAFPAGATVLAAPMTEFADGPSPYIDNRLPVVADTSNAVLNLMGDTSAELQWNNETIPLQRFAIPTRQDPTPTGEYVVFAWNDLGMHCLNPSYDALVILPPYNTLWAQVVQPGNPPRIVTEGLTVEYEMVANSYTAGKREYGQFWEYDEELFGVDLEQDKGLNLVEPEQHNGLKGSMVAMGDRFQVDGIPLSPVDDAGQWYPYQVAKITVKDSQGAVVAATRAVAPTSDEINCTKCHGDNAFETILDLHDSREGTTLAADAPVLCASCHGSPALGTEGPGVSYLSQAIHGSHAGVGAACYDCHPGPATKCMRSTRHTSADGNCVACHGDMAQVSSSIATGQRVPWVDEPGCITCHDAPEVDTGSTLYRNATGHGKLYCPACHGSPHAMVPSQVEADNYQAMQYQGKALSMGSCAVCHDNSKGPRMSLARDDDDDDDDNGGLDDDFSEEHGGSNPDEKTACHVCHTSVSSNTAAWPHQYMWKDR